MARTALRFDSRRGLELELCRSRQPTYGGGLWDAFLTKFNPTCTALVYSTYMGSTLDDRGYAIAVYRDASDNMHAYVTDLTTSPSFPTTAGAFQTTFVGARDALAAHFRFPGMRPRLSNPAAQADLGIVK